MTALQSVGWKVGTLAHTVSYQEVLFFPDGNKKVVLHALAKKLVRGLNTVFSPQLYSLIIKSKDPLS
ncbi:hypothetical protein BYT27DRAFT_7195577 [Phlegmacium glaucopus]|nr:hypothetical protein BYT27DRAFT_7195577 [Phlegmacium glaucopus]